MNPTATATALAEPVYDVGGRFMLDGATFARGAELGLAGMAFYFVGRAGVLGDVDAATVVAELGVFEPSTVQEHWAAGVAVMRPQEAAGRFMACGHTWARTHLREDLDGARLAELAFAVADATRSGDPTGVPALFAAWRDQPRPADPRAAALHGVHLLRELRGGLHVDELRRAGLDPHRAVLVRQGAGMASLFGWSEPHPDVEVDRDTWQAVEDRTNERAAEPLAVLDEHARAELVELVRSTQ